MSQAPRNPFDTGPDQIGQPAQKSSNTWLWVLGIIGGVFLIGGGICCGVGLLAWNKTTGFIAETVVEEFADDPIVVEKIGTITSSEMNMGETVNESSSDESVTVMVFDVRGENGSGRIVHRTNQMTGEVSAKLVMENGEEFDLEISDDDGDDGDAGNELEGLEEMETPEEVVETVLESGDESAASGQ